mmetsp:Transcript_39634/g.84522  ORF Transcript_39634/g.84522 Transcript_39634/m.84522 type:complete len:429 (-) Transcript_39634:1217-2503(-)
MDARVHDLCAQTIEAVLRQCFAEVLRCCHPLLLPLLLLQPGVVLIVAASVVLPLIPTEGAGVGPHNALGRRRFCCDALDEHPDGHARREAVRVEEDVRSHAALRKGHVLLGPQDAHDALLPMSRRELVAHDGIPGVAQLDHRTFAGFAPLDFGALDQVDRLDMGALVVLVCGDVLDPVLVHRTTDGVALVQFLAKVREAIVVEVLFEPPNLPIRVQVDVGESASRLVAIREALCGRCLDDLGLVDHAVAEAPLVGGLVDNHRILHVVARVGDDCHHRVGPSGVRIAVGSVVHLCAHQWRLWVEDPVDLVVSSVGVAVVGRPHGLLQHLALVHVARALVVVRERGQTGQEREHLRGLKLLVRVLQRQLLGDLAIGDGAALPLLLLKHSVRALALRRHDGHIEDELLQGADPLRLVCEQASHRADNTARP